MELVEQLQKLAPWAADLPLAPKIILSLLIAGVAALFLTVIWSTPSAVEKKSVEAVRSILDGCYRRAVFTRTHAQMDHNAMFASITECRAIVQSKVPVIARTDLRQTTADLISALEGIEREKTREPWDFSRIDAYKLEALKRFTLLSRLTGVPYTLPTNLTEEIFFSKQEADLPPTIRAPTAQPNAPGDSQKAARP